MPRTPAPGLRTTLVLHAAQLLAGTEPVTLRRVAAAAGTSTMAVYTQFGGMPGLWAAVRQEGFRRLAAALAGLRPTADPVADVTAVGKVYVGSALAQPALYLTMFDNRHPLADDSAATGSLQVLIEAVARAVAAGRFGPVTPPEAGALRLWAQTHGLVMLVLTDALPAAAIDEHLPAMSTAAYVGLGDDPERAAASTAAGWPSPTPTDDQVT